ncbi:hypothetical protein GCM10020001_076000 [Nonomuraea salmonea]
MGASRRWSCQSQVCTVRGGPLSGSTTEVEHSPWPIASMAARISVRALTTATCHGSNPAPAAIPAISSARFGAQSALRSSARSPHPRTCAGVAPATANRSV